MKRGWRVSGITLLAGYLVYSCVFDKTEGLGPVWQYFLSNRNLAGLTMLSALLIAIGGSLGYAGLEIYRYFGWRAGKADWADLQRELAWTIHLQTLASPRRLWAMLVAGHQGTYYELRQAYRRAKRRWPRKKGELRSVLRRPWKLNEWKGAAVLLVGEVLLFYFSYRFPREHLSPELSVLGTIGGVILANLLALLVWLAGDDDEGGPREDPAPPLPISGKGILPVLRVHGPVRSRQRRRKPA